MVNWIASLLVLIVALKHMEMVEPCATGLSWRQRLAEIALGLAWVVLGLWSFMRVIRPFTEEVAPPGLHDTLIMVILALVLLVREFWFRVRYVQHH